MQRFISSIRFGQKCNVLMDLFATTVPFKDSTTVTTTTTTTIITTSGAITRAK